MSSQADDKKTLKSIDMKEEQFRIESDLLGEEALTTITFLAKKCVTIPIMSLPSLT